MTQMNSAASITDGNFGRIDRQSLKEPVVDQIRDALMRGDLTTANRWRSQDWLRKLGKIGRRSCCHRRVDGSCLD